MNIKFQLNLFWKEFVLFGSTLFIGIFSAHKYTPLLEKDVIHPATLSWDSIIVLIAFFSIFMMVITKFSKLRSFVFKFFLLLVIFSGTQIIAGSFVASPWDLLLALILAAIFLSIHSVFVHNISIVLGIAGVSSLLGVTISPQVGVVLLIILSFYDILAVYWTKHMVYLAKGMMESGAIFGFIVPFQWRDFFYHKTEAKQQVGEKFMILGSGDIGLPLILASSIAVASLGQAFITAIFSLIGLFLTHLIFVNQATRKPMAALPPIATLSIIGYLVSQLW
jgi:presenilin-like A22 family membrane protease